MPPEAVLLYLLIAAATFMAAAEQTISGFGFSLLVMPLFALLLGLPVAAPLVALQGLTLYIVNVIRYHRRINLPEAINLGLAAAAGVPLGVWALVNLDPQLVKLLLGVFLVGYSLYSLALPALPRLVNGSWAYLAGFLSGCLGGAYNVAGPPVVVYGTLRQWPKEEFRAVLQVNFVITGSLTVLSHLLGQRVTVPVWTFFALAVPAQLLGVLAGSRLDPRVDKARFRILVTVMILLLGISTIVGAMGR